MNDLIFFHKVVNNLVPVALPHYLSFYMGGSRLRNCHLDSHSIVCSIIPRFSQQSSRSNNPLTKSFFYRTHLLWNGLPLELRQKCCPSSFKSELIKHLWSSITNDELDSSLNSSSSSTNQLCNRYFLVVQFNMYSINLQTKSKYHSPIISQRSTSYIAPCIYLNEFTH